MAQSLKSKSAKGFAWNFGGSLLKQGSSFIISIFLARILSPAEFGLVGMAMVFITVSQVFIDVGFASALIQRQDNSKLTYSSIFYLNLFIGLLLTALFYFCAPLIGAFYHNVKITELVRWLSLIFVFNSMDLVQITILKKELNFRVLTIRTFSASIIGGVLGIIAAISGLGVYSLVIQVITTAILGTILLWSTSGWRPDLKFSMAEVKKLTGFSSYVFFDRILASLSQQLDVLMVGKIFSPGMLGFYSRSVTLKNIVTSYSSDSLTAVFYPILSSLQSDEKEYSRVYFKVISVVAFLSYGLTGVMCILGKDIILLLFGAKWGPSVLIFQVIILMACNTPINSMMIFAFLSKGKSKQNFWIGIIRKVTRLIPLAFMYYYGMFVFTIAFVIFSYCITGVNIFFMNKYTRLSAKEHLIKIFEGMLPLALVLSAYFYVDPQKFFLRIIWAFAFVLFYYLYNKVLKTDGLEFLKSNLPLVKRKLFKR